MYLSKSMYVLTFLGSLLFSLPYKEKLERGYLFFMNDSSMHFLIYGVFQIYCHFFLVMGKQLWNFEHA